MFFLILCFLVALTPKFHIPLEFPLTSQINLTAASGAVCKQHKAEDGATYNSTQPNYPTSGARLHTLKCLKFALSSREGQVKAFTQPFKAPIAHLTLVLTSKRWLHQLHDLSTLLGKTTSLMHSQNLIIRLCNHLGPSFCLRLSRRRSRSHRFS